MRKITFLLAFVGLAMFSFGQTKITFESDAVGTSGGASAVWDGGTVGVIANAYTTGNPSTKVLHVQNNGYLGVHFSNVSIPASAQTVYSKLKVKYLIIGGTDTDYPSLEIYSAPNNYTMGDTEKIGTLDWPSLWGAAELGVWKTIEFTFASATLNPIPAGNLILRLVKSNTEYLIDDIELVPVPEPGSIFTVNDFESNTINEVLNMRRWSPTDASATVEANPTEPSNKSVHIISTNWDSGLKLNVVLPAGKVLADYDRLTFDIYLNNISGTDQAYKNMQAWVDGTKVIETLSAGIANAWEAKSYPLASLAGANSFELDLGLSTPAGNYYLDNIKLYLKDLETGFENLNGNALMYSRNGNTLNFNQNIDNLVVYDVQGRNVISTKNVSDINMSKLSNGVYILKSEISGVKYITKIIR